MLIKESEKSKYANLSPKIYFPKWFKLRRRSVAVEEEKDKSRNKMNCLKTSISQSTSQGSFKIMMDKNKILCNDLNNNSMKK